MSYLKNNVSTFIKTQFPAYYREEGDVLVEFVTDYYRWLESPNNAVYHTRRIPGYLDIDETAEEYLVYFKETYLKGIQFEVTTNIRQLIKHSLDIYRSKGTERSIDLLFR